MAATNRIHAANAHRFQLVADQEVVKVVAPGEDCRRLRQSPAQTMHSPLRMCLK
jgi:hypothetical protein